MTAELYVLAKSIDPLVKLQGLVSASDIVSPIDLDVELADDICNAAIDFVHNLDTWRTAGRKNMPPEVELKYAVVRHAKANGSQKTAQLLADWATSLGTDAVKEALNE